MPQTITRDEALLAMRDLAAKMKTTNDEQLQLAAAVLCITLASIEKGTTKDLANLLLVNLVTGSEEALRLAAAIGGSIENTPPQKKGRRLN
jgi:hypothetical protein